MSQRVIDDLTEAECLDLLRAGGVGRFVFTDADGPAAVPVNYGLADEEIVFRLEPHSHLREMLKRPVAFEVDEADVETGEGWSVLVRGAAREVDADDVPDLVKEMGDAFPKPLAAGVHNVWVAISARRVTGKRLAEPYFFSIF